MGANAGVVHPVRRLIPFALGIMFALLASVMASAADYIPRGQPIPQNIRVVGTTATGVNASMTTMYLNATGNTTYHKVPVPINASTLGKLGKTALKRIGPAAALYQTVKGILDGVGWFIDEARDQITIPGSPQQPLNPNGWCNTQSQPSVCVNSVQAAKEITMAKFAGNTDIRGWHIVDYPGPQYMNICGMPGTSYNGQCVRAENWFWRTTTGYPNGHPAATPDTDISDYDVGQLLKQHPEVINAILIDPETGAPIRTQEVIDALNNLRRALEAANGTGVPQPDLEVDDGWEQGEETPHETEWPGFCEWAETVCSAIEWFRSEDDPYEKPEVPWEETPVEMQSWSSGIGGGTCPAPISHTVTIGGVTGNLQFSVQPICDVGSKLYPLVIAISTLLGLYIVGGWRRAANA